MKGMIRMVSFVIITNNYPNHPFQVMLVVNYALYIFVVRIIL